MEQLIIVNFLKSFFKIFKAKIENYKITGKELQGILSWDNEDDKQGFIFRDEFDALLLSKASYLCDYLNTFKLIDGDKIIISELDLVEKLKKDNWSDKEIMETISFLLNFDVKMIDDGEETDSFFIHF